MQTPALAALEATRSIRRSRAFASLPAAEQLALDADLRRIESVLGAGYGPSDPYAVPMETPADLGGFGPGVGAAPGAPGAGAAQPQPAPPAPAQRAGTEVIGQRARATLEAVDFPSFVAGLMEGTFQAIVDATTHQLREYARLVASIAQSVDDFARDNVSPNQVRDWLAGKFPQDLVVSFPRPGQPGSPHLLPRRPDAGESPGWLKEYDLEGQELTAELTDGALLDAARRTLAEERLQTLATMVLMGVNRIVVSDGQIRAKLQFHASARETVKADVQQGSIQSAGGIASREIQSQSAVSTMVSTVSVNAQADVSIKADLVGEVSIRFRSETFDLNRFADPDAMALITRHSRQRTPPPAANVPAAIAPAPIAPAPVAPVAPGGAP